MIIGMGTPNNHSRIGIVLSSFRGRKPAHRVPVMLLTVHASLAGCGSAAEPQLQLQTTNKF
jgi:hypothetical protein